MTLNLYPVLTIAGATGSTYRIEATSDLANTNVWTTLTNLTLPSSPYDFTATALTLRPVPEGHWRIARRFNAGTPVPDCTSPAETVETVG